MSSVILVSSCVDAGSSGGSRSRLWTRRSRVWRVCRRSTRASSVLWRVCLRQPLVHIQTWFRQRDFVLPAAVRYDVHRASLPLYSYRLYSFYPRDALLTMTLYIAFIHHESRQKYKKNNTSSQIQTHTHTHTAYLLTNIQVRYKFHQLTKL